MTPDAYMYIIKASVLQWVTCTNTTVGYVNQHTDNGIYQCHHALVRASHSDLVTPVSAFKVTTQSSQKVYSVLLNNYLKSK